MSKASGKVKKKKNLFLYKCNFIPHVSVDGGGVGLVWFLLLGLEERPLSGKRSHGRGRSAGFVQTARTFPLGQGGPRMSRVFFPF